MIRNLLLTIGLVLATSALVFSQSGTLRGKVIDKTTKEPIPFVNIVVELGGTQAGGTTSDFDGNYTIKPITPGRYNLKATFVGFKPVMIQGLIIKSDQITFQNVEMESTMIEIQTFEVVDYKVPLIDKDKTSVGATVTSEEIAKMPNRSANAIATTVGGVFSADGERGSVRGQRSEGTVMYIDGIRVRGSSSLPESAIEQVSVILSGVPAQYGDATGGIINVTTKGPSREFGAGIELQTSQYLDAFGYNRAGLNMQGPLLWNKDKTSSLLGYFVAGEVVYNQDSRPTATGIYKVKDDVLRQLEATPLRLSGTGFGTYYNTNFVRQSDLEFVKATPNTANIDINASGKIDVKTGPNINLSLGGSINFSDGRNFNYAQSMFNYDKNIQVIDNTWRVFARFTQRFPADKESKSLIKNVFYTIQADYTKYDQTVQDADHKDQLFNYGYLGKYETNKIRSYEFGFDTITQKTAFIHNGFQDIAVDFTPGTANPIISNYTRQYYELYPEDFYHNNLNNIISGGGLLNGMTAPAIYGLWGSPGASQAVVGNQAGYQRIDNEQYAINANASADIGNHALQFGFIYEQRVDRYYNYTPIGLWSLMRGLTNAHIEQLDVTNPKLVYLDGVFMDTIYYDRKYDALSQRYFDKSLRSSIGLPADGTDWIDIDSYDVNALTINYYDANGKRHTASLANALSIDMFSPDELLNNGENLASYSGYTYTGERVKLKDSPSFDDFFTKRDADGNFTREIAPFSPIYMAGFIQDKFAFDDLIFNIGVRVDRFDANQQVLTDPYTIYPALTVNEVNDLGQHPQNMGNDYVVYVDNMRNPTTIMGYRNGDTWYNADGLVVTDPSISLDAGNGVTPYLADRNNVTVSSKAFSDYEPQISVMPRISFSFPISDEALFFAHYDVLTQRPTYALRMNPLDYFFLPVLGSPTINNPNLKPEKTIDYELGFQQRLTNSSSLTLSAYYREIRDQIQAYRYTAAYPKTYYSYNNIDFSTVKGLTVTYDLRRTSNARVRASYTLQFANGTGSDPEFAKGLIQTGQPNLRTLFPLSFDRRHALNLMLDYRFAEGKEYNGPVIRRKKTDAAGAEVVKTTQLLKNTGVNFTIFGGSGTPYTKSSKIVQLGQSGIIDGSVNGSRLPWQFRIDGRVDKDINVSWGEGKRQSYLNVYLQVLNILDSKNIMSVYAATGNPDDDGYLAAAEYQTQINSQLDPDAYRELYSLRINSPGNYSSPRQIRLGLIFNF